MILIYTVIFSRVMQGRLPGNHNPLAYSFYLCTGILIWGLFAEVVGRAQGVFLEYANLLKKLQFPRVCLPAIILINAVLNFLIVFTIFTAVLILTNSFPGWPYIALLPLLLIQLCFSIGLGIGLGVLNVFFRDVGQFVNIALQLWFWCTPVVYPLNILPEKVQGWLLFNPMTRIIEADHQILIAGEWPNWISLWWPMLLAVLFCWWGMRAFRVHSADMVDEL
jgi:lipopolysaccharide transport system permease protein